MANTLVSQVIDRASPAFPNVWSPYVTVAIFVAITGAAMLTGHWQNSITARQYLEQQPYVRGYGHPISGSEMERLGRPQIDNQKQ